MIKRAFQVFGILYFCGTIAMLSPLSTYGAEQNTYIGTEDTKIDTSLRDTAQGTGLTGGVAISPLDPAGGKGTISPGQAPLAQTPLGQAMTGDVRMQVVNYALQFAGGPYRNGGEDPRTGADCSGFTKYIMQNTIGLSLNRISRDQAVQGTPVDASQMRPGDLVFYGGSNINHVALYIGNNQIIHAATYATGIKVAPWDYETPTLILNVIGD